LDPGSSPGTTDLKVIPIQTTRHSRDLSSPVIPAKAGIQGLVVITAFPGLFILKNLKKNLGSRVKPGMTASVKTIGYRITNFFT
jgi:hypothetical protein